MGGSVSAAETLPQIWQRINASHLRHRITHEIIEEHSLTFPSAELQQADIAALQRRIALHHPGVPRVIYFRQAHSDGLCGALAGEYRLVVYSQHRGDSLERVAGEKGERHYHSPCQCVHLLSAAHYLRDRYGCFVVSPAMVSLGTRRENISKLWIHSSIQISHPEMPTNEENMCASLVRLLLFIRNHRICNKATNEQLASAFKIKQLTDLKAFVVEMHRTATGEVFRKKSHSECNPASNHQASFHSHKDDNMIKNSVLSSSLYQPAISRPRIQFSYTSQNQPSQIPILHQLPPNIEMPQPHQRHSDLENNITQPPLFSPIMQINAPSQQVSHFNSHNASPDSKNIANFTGREMEIPLKEAEEKGTSTHLPTTSRSPKAIRDHPFHPIEEIPQLPVISKERRMASQEGRQWRRKDKHASLHSSGNKFEKYRDAIRNYEEKLRLKFANSMGSNPLTAKRKTDLVIRQANASPPKGEYKETESLYNNSEAEEEDEGTTSIAPQIQTQTDMFAKFEEPKALLDRKELQQTNENSNEEELQNKRMREHLQKLQLEKDLQREKAIIDSEMQDLLKQNTMREQYRSIHDKIKQKKETFAQLKAEAAKILEDLDY